MANAILQDAAWAGELCGLRKNEENKMKKSWSRTFLCMPPPRTKSQKKHS
ncbi:hypothetical protein RSAG8_12435, partial [Rhizoctonia solani AG-8 WAC10335]